MNTHPYCSTDALHRHLAGHTCSDIPGVASYIDRGGALVTPEAIDELLRERKALRAKIETLRDSELLRRRLTLLACFFEEACTDGHAGTTAQREVVFALLYFLKDLDRIPDSIPEVGLLDDAMIVDLVLQRHRTTLRAHWLRRRRELPPELSF
jgi:uncharacterized membrane protein YkvA (DUF1232 family)